MFHYSNKYQKRFFQYSTTCIEVHVSPNYMQLTDYVANVPNNLQELSLLCQSVLCDVMRYNCFENRRFDKLMRPNRFVFFRSKSRNISINYLSFSYSVFLFFRCSDLLESFKIIRNFVGQYYNAGMTIGSEWTVNNYLRSISFCRKHFHLTFNYSLRSRLINT